MSFTQHVLSVSRSLSCYDTAVARQHFSFNGLHQRGGNDVTATSRDAFHCDDFDKPINAISANGIELFSMPRETDSQQALHETVVGVHNKNTAVAGMTVISNRL